MSRDDEELTECVYCRRHVDARDHEIAPSSYDDEAWSKLAEQHSDGCEWVRTRAHRR